MEENRDVIVTLLVEEGKKPGEPVAFHNLSIVFLPKGSEPGKQVRVRLIPIGKVDRRGNPMYQGVPAPVEYTEKWKDNGDGTASRVTIATDWLGKTSEEGVVETRALAIREAAEQATTRTDREVVWGGDLASSGILMEQVTTIPTFSECVTFPGTLSEKKVSAREERSAPESLPILRVRVWADDFDAHKLEIVYQDTWKLVAECYYTDSNFVRENTVWGSLPAWLQAQVRAEYPVCSCGRQRRDANISDGYGKCQLCRAEERCQRCNKQEKMVVIGGRLICGNCSVYEEAEQLIVSKFSADERTRIADEARKLLNGQAFAGADGETVLRATAEHILEGRQRNNLLKRWAGYGWYYLCQDGIWATKFAPAALQLLQLLPQATGNGLVDMVAWVVGGPNPSVTHPNVYVRDFYMGTQVDCESGLVPKITEEILQRGFRVADRLRGSEADRIAAIVGYHRLVAKLGDEADEVKAVAQILQANEQDYAAALVEITKADEFLAVCASGEVLRDFRAWHRRGGAANCGDGWVVRADGSLREPDGNTIPRHKSDGNLIWKLVAADELAIVWRQHPLGSVYEAIKLPVGGCTPAQISAVARIEEELGAQPCTFLVSEALRKQAETTLEAVRQLLERVVGKTLVPQFAWQDLVGHYGVLIERRQLPAITAFRVAGGMLEFEPVDRYGFHGIGARWRPLTPEEARTAKQQNEPTVGMTPPQPAKPATPGKPEELGDQLAKRWGGKFKK